MKIKDITLKSSREIEVIESAINFLNKNLFDNKLSNIKVTIQPDTSTKNMTYGWACSQIWSNGKVRAHELNITANALKRNKRMTIESAMIVAIRRFNKKKLGSIRDMFPMEWGYDRKGKTNYVGFQITYAENRKPDCPYKVVYEYIRKEDMRQW